MSSLIKANKNLVSRIIKDLSRKYSESKGTSINPVGKLVNVNPKNVYGLGFYISVQFDIKLRAVESDGYIFIGACLKQPMTLTWSNFKSLEDTVFDLAFPSWGDGHARLLADIGHTREEVEQDPSILRPVVQKIERVMDDIVNHGKAVVTLDDGDFPRCKDRSIVPIVVLNVEDGVVNYCAKRGSYSSRQGRNSESFASFNMYSMVRAVRCTEVGHYLKASIQHPYIESQFYL